MGIQSSVNSLLSQTQSLAAFYKGFEKAGDIIKGQEAQTEATKKLQESFEKRFRKEFKIDEKTPLTSEQNKAVEYGDYWEKWKGTVITPSEALKRTQLITKTQERRDERKRLFFESQRAAPEVRNELASDLARASVEARTASINKTKSNFDEHVASLIKYYGKGSGNP